MSTNDLRKQRKRAGLSAAELASRAGLSPSTVYLIEGGWKPRQGTRAIERIARALEAS